MKYLILMFLVIYALIVTSIIHKKQEGSHLSLKEIFKFILILIIFFTIMPFLFNCFSMLGEVSFNMLIMIKKWLIL